MPRSTRTHVLAVAATLALILGVSRSAVAEPAAAPAWSLRFEVGSITETEHLHPLGDEGTLPAYYGSVSAERRLVPRFSVQGTAGVALNTGLLVRPSARFAFVEMRPFALTVGVGPLFFDDQPAGWAVFADADVRAEVRIGDHALISAAASAAWALHDKGKPNCGTDWCDGFIERGDTFRTLRVGAGFQF